MRSLSDIKGVGPVTEEKLNHLGIFNISDLMNFLPTNYIDLDAISSLTCADEGSFVLLKLVIVKASRPFSKGRLSIFTAYGETEEKIRVKLSFFNSNFVSKFIKEGVWVRCYGKLKIDKYPELINPAYELFDGINSKFTGVKPIYPTKGHIPQATIIGIIGDALKDFEASSLIPGSILESKGMLELNDAYQMVHKPQTMLEITSAAERIVFEGIVKRICAYKLIKEEGKRTVFYTTDAQEIVDFIDSLPYVLTPTQRAAYKQIIDTMRSEKPLNAMLTGDVGSGKTLVAVISAFFAAKSKKQVAILAPTEILAMQHFRSFNKLYEGFGIKVALLVGSQTSSEKRIIKEEIALGNVDVVIGTHAVLSKNVNFRCLSMMIIDEQHRFGVAQRTALKNKGKSVDVLTLSATPIPRSLRLTMYGDMDVIGIDRRHSSDNIITAVVHEPKRKGMLDYIANECENGKQAYVVCPRIVDDEGIDSGSAESVYDELSELYGNRINIALLHGKISASEKDRILSGFSAGEISILVSTTVIEVGIDVPNASIMVVFGAERFGLATLHQLRGRIGRNGARAYCFLYTTKEDENIRLSTLVQERDGMAIAEQDYAIRGAGDWMGESQSGSMGKFSPSIQLMKEAKLVADSLDITNNREELLAYAEQLALEKVSLN